MGILHHPAAVAAAPPRPTSRPLRARSGHPNIRVGPLAATVHWTVAALAGLSAAACAGPPIGAGPAEARDPPHAVTADIQAAIEAYIDEETRRGGGYFRFSADGEEHAFRLVRVHTEYLSRLGPRRYFACVDLADTAGDVYDVDFFLEGEEDSMSVTETTIHKRNGRPFYLWRRAADSTWVRVPTDSAPPDLLEVVNGEDAFEFRYAVRLPDLEGRARMWIPLPASDSFQTVSNVSVRAPVQSRLVLDPVHRNRALYFEFEPEDGGEVVEVRYRVRRVEKAAYAGPPDEAARYLALERTESVPEIRRIAAEATRGRRTDLEKARALYDRVMEEMRYMKFGDGWGEANVERACRVGSGNCSDYHAFFVALARASGIPARFAVGAAIPATRDDGGIDGYHCWAEFYADGKWWPVDISEADKYTALATYYFGHHPANRVEFSRGRHLVFDPAPASGPVNFFAYPVLEVAGVRVPVTPRFSFVRN